MPKFKLLVLSNAAEGREDEYNDWYTRQHLSDVLRVPGVVQAQRYRLTDAQRGAAPPPYKYMALYDCEADNAQQVIDGLAARAGTADMPISTAMAESRISCFFEPITDALRSAAP